MLVCYHSGFNRAAFHVLESILQGKNIIFLSSRLHDTYFVTGNVLTRRFVSIFEGRKLRVRGHVIMPINSPRILTPRNGGTTQGLSRSSRQQDVAQVGAHSRRAVRRVYPRNLALGHNGKPNGPRPPPPPPGAPPDVLDQHVGRPLRLLHLDLKEQPSS